MNKEPVKITERKAQERISSFDEVVLGYTEEQALQEARRCLQCKNPSCISGCPVGINIKKFIRQITEGDYEGAYLTIREKNNFPSICGRVCPAKYQCRHACVFTRKGEPFASPQAINIHFLERFVGDYGIRNNLVVRREEKSELSRFRVAVVGSGPASLSCAGELARRGVGVTVFESLHKPGGVLRYGIPPFRLPREILDFEIDYLRKLGVEIVTNCLVGRTVTLDDLFAEGYAAVFLGLGAGVPSFLGVPGENLGNVYSANEFLTRVNLMQAYKFPQYHTPLNIGKHIVVIGGGNTAMDAARVSIRLQKMNSLPLDVSILYRRTEVEMPARRLEIEHARQEGVRFNFLIRPIEFIGKDGYIRKVRCIKCKLGSPDSSGRRRPVDIPGSEFELESDLVIVAIGIKANQVLTRTTPQITLDKYGDIQVDPETMETSMKNVFAGGDIVGGEGTVIEAMGMGKKAATSIITRLEGKLCV